MTEQPLGKGKQGSSSCQEIVKISVIIREVTKMLHLQIYVKFIYARVPKL